MNREENMENHNTSLGDYGKKPFAVNIDRYTRINKNFRTALWTGEHMQLTLMSIPAGGEIGLEMHDDLDQFIKIEEGIGFVMMGESKEALNIQNRVNRNYAVLIPAGTYHNLKNIGSRPLKLYSIYSPPAHPFGTAEAVPEKERSFGGEE